MATIITSECINCGACEPECPNTAIYQGGVEWELNGATHPAISQDIFYIVPEKCTECVGFHDHEACAAVCPVDCCIPDPNNLESEAVLLERAKVLHPGTDFGADFPSRFKGGNGAAEAAPADSAAAPAATVAAPAAVAAPPKAAPAAPVAAGRAERPLAPPKPAGTAAPAPTIRKTFAAELPIPYEEAYARLSSTAGSKGNGLLSALALLLQPILGALPFSQKKVIEEAVGNKWVFTAAGATGVNILHNFILYPAIFLAVGALSMKEGVFTQKLSGMVTLGVALATLEAIIRLREGILRAAPADEIVYRAAWYAPPFAILFAPFTRRLKRHDVKGSIAVDGFHGGDFDDKTERERRYGEVYTLEQRPNGYLLHLEFPRRVPNSGQKEEMGIPDEMPDYDYELSLENQVFVVRASVPDLTIRKLAGVSPAFPPDFTTHVELPGPVSGFKHRIENKTLEVALLK